MMLVQKLLEMLLSLKKENGIKYFLNQNIK